MKIVVDLDKKNDWDSIEPSCLNCRVIDPNKITNDQNNDGDVADISTESPWTVPITNVSPARII